ncbi:hypothetical protein PR048_010311 [Dryococelus australis]|uniref:Uncharacterized protein n=1 Tax=Dryococelus australis TaxID=614101 RepID=A0ABQ9I2H5_9NEOP|nr:hypothetical protein PR048_010311 [Dryococelus australis]
MRVTSQCDYRIAIGRVWSDMTIETKLMRFFKTNTGLTCGRGISDSVISKWIVEMSVTHDICASLKEFCGVLFSSSEQHIYFSMTRITRNTANIGKLAVWLDNHTPFPIMSEIMSIATGVVGDCTIINCYEAVTIVKQAMKKIEVNGGFSMHKVIWPRGCTVSTVCEAYTKYVKSHYPGRSCGAVFARPTPSTSRATILGGAAVLCLIDTPTHTTAQRQLNRSNAIDKFKQLDKSTFAVTGGDVDLAVLLMAKTPPDRRILLVKPGRGNIRTNVYSTKEIAGPAVDDDDKEFELPPTLVEELDENMEENIEDEDEEHESQPGSSRPKRSKLL